MNQTDQSIEIKALTLGDWLNIASVCNNSPSWGFFRWLENVPPDVVSSLSRADIDAIANHLDKSTSWVVHHIEANS